MSLVCVPSLLNISSSYRSLHTARLFERRPVDVGAVQTAPETHCIIRKLFDLSAAICSYMTVTNLTPLSRSDYLCCTNAHFEPCLR